MRTNCVSIGHFHSDLRQRLSLARNGRLRRRSDFVRYLGALPTSHCLPGRQAIYPQVQPTYCSRFGFYEFTT